MGVTRQSDTAFDDAVVGAGIIGLAHAYHLARAGQRVVVIERAPQACGASIRNFGMIWPIGQPFGPMRLLAMRSREIWLDVLGRSGIWFDPCGSLHLAYHEDEARVLREFLDEAGNHGYECALEDPGQIGLRASSVVQSKLIGGMWSPTEICVDPREVIAKLPGWLSQTYGVVFHYGETVTGHFSPYVRTGSRAIEAAHLWVCSGDEFHLLYPEVIQSLGLTRCKLQMMRTNPTRDGARIGPMLAAGSTLRHYKAFETCPSLPEVRKRFSSELPDFDRFGIHVMTSQNGRDEVVLGDSHEYGQYVEPFNREEIDSYILDYLKTFVDIPNLSIAQRWHGIYAKHPTEPYVIANPDADTTIVTGLGGAGMTLSFGVAERIVLSSLSEAGVERHRQNVGERLQ